MRRVDKWIAPLLIILFSILPARAQDALNLPAELYVLMNTGQVDRYGVGAAGVTTVTPEDAFVIDFGVDSSGQRLAYRTEAGFAIANLSSGLIDHIIDADAASVPPYRGRGETMVWSPAGDALAFTTLDGARVFFENDGSPIFADLREGIFLDLRWSPGGRFLAAEAEQNVWWIYRRDGTTMALSSVIPASIGTAWVSEAEIVFAPPEGSLRLMNLDAANAQTVLLGDNVEYRLPALNERDQLVFFARDKADSTIPEEYGVLLMLARGAQQIETLGQSPIALTGLRWAPGATLMVAFQGGVIALFDPATGAGFPLPISGVVAYSWGALTPAGQTSAPPVAGAPTSAPQATESAPTATPEPPTAVTGLAMITDGFFLAPDNRGLAQVWRMPANGTAPARFTGASALISEFTPAPDGRSVVYVSDGQLWLQRIEVAQPSVLATLNSFAPVNAALSSDGARIAYVDETEQQGGIWIVPFAGGEPERVLVGLPSEGRVYRRPRWSADGSRLLLDVYSGGLLNMGILDLADGSVTEIPSAGAADPRPLNARWMLDGRVLSYSDALTGGVESGLYVWDADAPETPAERLALPEGTAVRSLIEYAPGELRVLLADALNPNAPLAAVDISLAAGSSRPVLEIAPLTAPRLAPDGRFIAGYDGLVEMDGVQQGPLVLVDLQSGQRAVLSQPEAVWGFRWSR